MLGSQCAMPTATDPTWAVTIHKALLLSSINSSKKVVDDKLAEFCEEICRSNNGVSEKLAKKIRSTKPVEFKRKGNQKQHEFNERLSEKLDNIKDQLPRIPN